jgi:hypothetical protein
MDTPNLIPLSKIAGTFLPHRSRRDWGQIRGLAELLNADPEFHLDPVVLIQDPQGDGLLIVSGFHRVEAYRQAHREAVPAIIIEDARQAVERGTQDNAIGTVPLDKVERRRLIRRLLDLGVPDERILSLLSVPAAWLKKVKMELNAKPQPFSKPGLPQTFPKYSRKGEKRKPDAERIFKTLKLRARFLARELADFEQLLADVTNFVSTTKFAPSAYSDDAQVALKTVVEGFMSVYEKLKELHKLLNARRDTDES